VRPPLHKFVMVGFAALAILVTAAGCAKKVSPPRQPLALSPRRQPNPRPCPTLTLSASPGPRSSADRPRCCAGVPRTRQHVTIDGGIRDGGSLRRPRGQPDGVQTYTARGHGNRVWDRECRNPHYRDAAHGGDRPPPPRDLRQRVLHDVTSKISFTTTTATISAKNARQILRDNARALAERQVLQLLVEGHCDERGSEKYNLASAISGPARQGVPGRTGDLRGASRHHQPRGRAAGSLRATTRRLVAESARPFRDCDNARVRRRRGEPEESESRLRRRDSARALARVCGMSPVIRARMRAAKGDASLISPAADECPVWSA